MFSDFYNKVSGRDCLCSDTFDAAHQFGYCPMPCSTLLETAIQSTGYVIHTLEASVWCLLNSASFQGATLPAANLGEDTDTTASVTGGLAGIYYGEGAIPLHWRHQLAQSEELGRFFDAFVSACQPPRLAGK